MHGVKENAIRPDNFLAVLVIDKTTNQHVHTVIGHYSEHLPTKDLTDKKEKNRLYEDFGSYEYVYLNNLILQDKFGQFFERCRDRKTVINFVGIFNNLAHFLSYYSRIDPDNILRLRYPVAPSIFQDSKVINYKLQEYRKKFDLWSISNQYTAPVLLGAFLQNMVQTTPK